MIDIKLYRVCSIVPVFRARKDVWIGFYVNYRYVGFNPYTGRYAEVIQDYEDCEEKLYSECLIDELFTLEEAEQFISWLKKGWPEIGSRCKIEEWKLPVPCNDRGLSTIETEGLQDTINMKEGPDYDLPFIVYGYYDLRQNDMAIDATYGTDRMDEQFSSGNEIMEYLMDHIHKMIYKRAFDKDDSQEEEIE